MQSVPITTNVASSNSTQARCTRYNIMWYSLSVLFSTNNTNCHDITEILLKVVLNTKNPNPNQYKGRLRFVFISRISQILHLLIHCQESLFFKYLFIYCLLNLKINWKCKKNTRVILCIKYRYKNKTSKIIWISDVLILSVPGEGYSRKKSCALNLIFTFF